MMKGRTSVRWTDWSNFALGSHNELGVGGYSWVMFGRKKLDEATGVTRTMLATSIGSIALSAQVDWKAAWAIVLLAGWGLLPSSCNRRFGAGTDRAGELGQRVDVPHRSPLPGGLHGLIPCK